MIEATITIKDTSQDLTLPFKLSINEGEATVKGETAIRRSDFGIGPSGPVSGMVIGDVVKLKLDLAANASTIERRPNGASGRLRCRFAGLSLGIDRRRTLCPRACHLASLQERLYESCSCVETHP